MSITSTQRSSGSSIFIPHHSTETAHALVLSDIFSAIDTGNLALLSLLDISAAFDTVDLQILLRRLYLSFRINSTLLDWLTSYLSGRNQSIPHCGNASSNTVLTCGVPQGSVFGPILLVLYTGDVISIIENISLLPHSYADDTKIHGFCQPDVKSIGYLRKDILDCINAVSTWIKSNRLQLNSLKTEFLWCASSRRQNTLDRSPFVIGTDSI